MNCLQTEPNELPGILNGLHAFEGKGLPTLGSLSSWSG